MKIVRFHIASPFLIFFLLLFCFSCSTEPSSNKHQDFILDEITIDDIHIGYKSDKYTVKDIVKIYVIKNYDRNFKLSGIENLQPLKLHTSSDYFLLRFSGKRKNPLFLGRN